MLKELDISSICPYCSATISEKVWKTDFEVHNHYKTLKCECGKKIRVKLDFISSGEWENHHNRTNGKREKSREPELLGIKSKETHVETLETKIKIVKEYSDNYECQGNVKNG